MRRHSCWVVLGAFLLTVYGLPKDVWRGITPLTAGEPVAVGSKVPFVTLTKRGPAFERIYRVLEEKTTFEFVDTPLSDGLSMLASLHKISIVLDQAALAEESIGTDEPMNLVIQDVTLRSGLKVLLKPLGLTYIIENEVLKVTTDVVAESTFETRVYDVRRLTKSGFESEALVRTIIGTVQPGSWHRAVTSVEVSADGRTVTFKNDTETIQLWDAQTGKPRSQPTKREAAIEPLPGWLVVRQTQETHGEIYGLLQTLQQLADTEP